MNDRLDIAVRIRRLDHAQGLDLPAYASASAAGMDIRAAVAEPLVIAPGAIEKVPTGLCLEVPEGYEVQVRPRSGLAGRHGVTVVNAPGTIDADYRGEVFVALVNHGAVSFTIERGMRIAQLVLARAPRIVWEEVVELSTTTRGDGGFGHTGTA